MSNAKTNVLQKMHMTEQIGIRELRQHLSVYLRRVEAGETLEVTERGEPVALLTPLPGRQSILDRLIADGHAREAKVRTGKLGRPAPALPGQRPLSEILQEMRDEDER